MKGKENVLSEVNLEMVCYNLRRLMSIFGVNALKNKLKSLDLYVLMLYKAIKAVFKDSNKKLYYIY